MVLLDKMKGKVMDKYVYHYHNYGDDRRGLINLGDFAKKCLQKRVKKERKPNRCN